MPTSGMGRCRSCGAEILWAHTPAGKAIPLDPYTHATGNVRLAGGIATVIDGSQPQPRPGELLYRAHFATCPHASDWRKRRDGGR